jgi:hypothetical protein
MAKRNNLSARLAALRGVETRRERERAAVYNCTYAGSGYRVAADRACGRATAKRAAAELELELAKA